MHLKLHILFWLKQSKKSDKWYFKCFNELGEWWISSCTCSLERHTLLHTHTGSSCSNYSLSLPEKIRLQLYSVMCLFVENKIYLVIRFVHAICFHHECIMYMLYTTYYFNYLLKSKVSSPMHFHFVGQGKFMNTMYIRRKDKSTDLFRRILYDVLLFL